MSTSAVAIRTVDGLHGRAYAWLAADLLVIERRLDDAAQLQAVEDAFTEARAQALALAA